MISPGRDENKKSLQPPPSLFSGGRTASFREGIPHLPIHQSRFSTQNTCPMSISLTISCAVRGESGISRIHCVTCGSDTPQKGRPCFSIFSAFCFRQMENNALPCFTNYPKKKQFVCLVNFSPMETWFKKNNNTFFCVC